MRGTNLAGELLENILIRLPVKSIIRFKCVKKSWSCFFQNPNFIAKHHRYRCSITNPSFLITSRDDSSDDIDIISLLHPPHNDVDDTQVHIVDMNIRFDTNLISMRFLRSNICTCINGIICVGGSFSGGFDGFFLWNPAIRQYKVVAYPTLHYPPGLDDYSTDSNFAFGYDHNSNDYKVVRIVNYGRDYHIFVHVYTLSTDSWRQKINTDIDLSKITFLSSFDEKYLNGVYYWRCILEDTDKHGRVLNSVVILSFHMTSEVFRMLSLPEFRSVPRQIKTFAVFNECLAFIFYNKRTTMEANLEIWVMRESGVQESWTKQLVVGPLFGVRYPLGFAKNGELLLLLRDDDQTIALYNIDSQEIKNLQFRDFPNSFKTSEAIGYVESLVSFEGDNVVQY
ncbi:F-box/kelch-repeat protein At3g23880-like [Castanea sativa]|uniref:F-box/kelch-repeat protein At3g23880-like n=1 Tax=Castanea sativa TaxID=21020 RepID=UPI003F65414F